MPAGRKQEIFDPKQLLVILDGVTYDKLKLLKEKSKESFGMITRKALNIYIESMSTVTK